LGALISVISDQQAPSLKRTPGAAGGGGMGLGFTRRRKVYSEEEEEEERKVYSKLTQ